MIINAPNTASSIKTGWYFGFGFFLGGLYWITIALTVDLENFGWLIPIGLILIPTVLGLYFSLVSYLTWKASHYIKHWRLVLAFAIIWTLVEMLRGYLFTGFPWNLIGSVWSNSDNIIQLASYTGIWGLSFFSVIFFAMPAIIWHNKISETPLNLFKRNSLPILITFIFYFGIAELGEMRLSNQTLYHPNIKLRLVQANIEQDLKWDEEQKFNAVSKFINLSQENNKDITHIIWPETALPFIVNKKSILLETIAKFIPKNGALITGVLRANYQNDGSVDNLWNSIITITDSGDIYSYYDKSHLVPFGEYIPFRSILPLKKITEGTIDFSQGTGVKTISAPSLPSFSGLVCYEIIFPGHVIDQNNPPEFIINATNDTWYGNSTGPYQHFAMTKMRAVEEGMPIVRVANSGISGVIDAYGRVIAISKLSTEAVVDSRLPKKIATTFYGRFGDKIIYVILFITFIIISLKQIKPRDKQIP